MDLKAQLFYWQYRWEPSLQILHDWMWWGLEHSQFFENVFGCSLTCSIKYGSPLRMVPFLIWHNLYLPAQIEFMLLGVTFFSPPGWNPSMLAWHNPPEITSWNVWTGKGPDGLLGLFFNEIFRDLHVTHEISHNFIEEKSQQTIWSLAQFTHSQWSSGDYGRLIMRISNLENWEGLHQSINSDLCWKIQIMSIQKAPFSRRAIFDRADQGSIQYSRRIGSCFEDIITVHQVDIEESPSPHCTVKSETTELLNSINILGQTFRLRIDQSFLIHLSLIFWPVRSNGFQTASQLP